ncbi:hypothetical protein B0H14DRAFT_991158 [Mycena olivaceomarginata]|nr:hypothetical protein B0H14DRAFT_991158 [Mycena olivaceomarginata]
MLLSLRLRARRHRHRVRSRFRVLARRRYQRRICCIPSRRPTPARARAPLLSPRPRAVYRRRCHCPFPSSRCASCRGRHACGRGCALQVLRLLGGELTWSTRRREALRRGARGLTSWSGADYNVHERITSRVDVQLDRELIQEGATGGLVIFEDHPSYWDAWNVEIHHLEKTTPLESAKVSVVAQSPLRASMRALDSTRLSLDVALQRMGGLLSSLSSVLSHTLYARGRRRRVHSKGAGYPRGLRARSSQKALSVAIKPPAHAFSAHSDGVDGATTCGPRVGVDVLDVEARCRVRRGSSVHGAAREPRV